MKKILEFLKSPFLRDYRTLFGLWMLLPVIMWIMKMTRANNYDIYRGSFWNAVRGWNLYLPNPEEYADLHHYGPVFSLLFAPFAIGPKWVGLLLWGIALTLFLYWAIRKSQFTKYQQIFILWFCAHEMLTALYMQQFNIAIAATILLAYYLIEKEKDFISALGEGKLKSVITPQKMEMKNYGFEAAESPDARRPRTARNKGVSHE